MGFSREEGVDGFFRDLLASLKRQALQLGFTEAAGAKEPTSSPLQNILYFLGLLPRKTLNFLLV